MHKNFRFKQFIDQNGAQKIEWTYEVKTACTDGTNGRLLFNPEFATKIYNQCGEKAIQFVILHEAMHNYFNNVRHAMKVTNVYTNIVCDKQINNEIIRRWNEFKEIAPMIGAVL